MQTAAFKAAVFVLLSHKLRNSFETRQLQVTRKSSVSL